jgi:hypothetical protein
MEGAGEHRNLRTWTGIADAPVQAFVRGCEACVGMPLGDASH